MGPARKRRPRVAGRMLSSEILKTESRRPCRSERRRWSRRAGSPRRPAPRCRCRWACRGTGRARREPAGSRSKTGRYPRRPSSSAGSGACRRRMSVGPALVAAGGVASPAGASRPLRACFSSIRAGNRLARNPPYLLMFFHHGGTVQRRVNTIATPHPDRRSGFLDRPPVASAGSRRTLDHDHRSRDERTLQLLAQARKDLSAAAGRRGHPRNRPHPGRATPQAVNSGRRKSPTGSPQAASAASASRQDSAPGAPPSAETHRTDTAVAGGSVPRRMNPPPISGSAPPAATCSP